MAAGNAIKQTLHIQGMTCAHCEQTVERSVLSLAGVTRARANHADGTLHLECEQGRVSQAALGKAIADAGYAVVKGEKRPHPGWDTLWLAAMLGMGYLMLSHMGLFAAIPQVDQSMGYGLLFVTGVLTSVHCIAMCGGICLSQSMKPQQGRVRGPLMYNLGRVLGYAGVGAIVGTLGQAVQFTGRAKGIVAIAAGLWMALMALNMMGFLAPLRRFMPRLPKGASALLGKITPKSSLGVGLLNALMPCGPLQAMQLYALGTASPIKGALSMAAFALGTVPLMLSLGLISARLTQTRAQKMMQIGAALVLVLSVGMLSNGLSLSGFNIAFAAPPSQGQSIARLEGEVQVVTSEVIRNAYAPVTVQVGVPVRMNLSATGERALNGCNNAILIPEYGITQQLKQGDNWVEFTPQKTGTISFSCWMGMIRSSIRVVEDIATVQPDG